MRMTDFERYSAKLYMEAGKPFKKIVVACIRKLLTILNVMVRNNQHWNPEFALKNL